MAEREGQFYVEILGTDVCIRVPEGAARERAAVAADARFQAIVEQGQREAADGRLIRHQDLDRYLDGQEAVDVPVSGLPRGRKPTTASGRLQVRLPVSLHRDLAARALHERVSVNQLILGYVARGLGQDERPASG